MKRFILKVAALVACVAAVAALGACSGNDPWQLNVKVESLGTQNITAVYYNERGGLKSITTAAIDGEFKLQGDSPQPTVVDIYSNRRVLIGRVPVVNGESVTATFSITSPHDVTIKGDRQGKAMADFLNNNRQVVDSGPHTTLDSLLLDNYRRREGDMSALLLMVDLYTNAADTLPLAAALETVPAPTAPGWLLLAMTPVVEEPGCMAPDSIWVRGDTLAPLVVPKNQLVAITGRMDTVARRRVENVLDSIARAGGDSLRVLEISLLPDTASWHRMQLAPKRRFITGWVPGSLASPVVTATGVKELPAYLTVDSTGTVTAMYHSLDSLTQQH